MRSFPEPIARLIDELGQLPGVGPKTAERYAFALLKSRTEDRQRLAETILEAGGSLTACSTCGNYTEHDPCNICSDPRRDRQSVCVVATEQDLLAVERTGEFQGLYHVLGGQLSPADGLTPQDLNIRQLLQRIRDSELEELILAFDHTVEGESTMMYLTRTVSSLNIRVTRLARGLPTGSEVGYADEITLTDALRGRREMRSQETVRQSKQPAD